MNTERMGNGTPDELDRLVGLSSLGLDMADMQDRLAPYVELAKQITDSPVCEINIIDAYYQWTIAGAGENIKVISREESVCQDTIRTDQAYEIRDLKEDDRYKDRFYVEGEPFFRYYCGVPLNTSENFNIGSICVLDKKAKELSGIQKKQLRLLSEAITGLLETEGRQKQLQQSMEDLKSDIRKLNHDVRTPISGIVGMAELFGDGKQEDADRREFVEVIRKCANEVVNKIDGVLETLTGEKKRLESAGTEVTTIVRKLENLYRPRALQKGISLDMTVEYNAPRRVTERLSFAILQIAGNLIANSLKFTPAGGSVEVLMEIPEKEHGEKADGKEVLRCTVSDNGKGMDRGQVEAFNSFERVEKRMPGTEGERSFGIGLMHVRKLVDTQGGEVRVESEAGKGSRFHLELSLDKPVW